MFVSGLILSSMLAARVIAQCDRATDCAASDPWYYQCTDGSRADYTDCANSCCGELNSAVCSDPVQSFDYYGCMDVCSASASARCGTASTTPPRTTSAPATTTSSSSSSSPTVCQVPRAAKANAAQCDTSARRSCNSCRHGVFESNGKDVTFDGCGQSQALQDAWWRKAQEEYYPEMTEVCNQHDRCFGICRSEDGLFQECNDALLAGAYGICEKRRSDRMKWCTDVMKETPENCKIETDRLYDGCVGELVKYTKLALKHQKRMCKAFKDAQSEFCKCSKS